MMRRVISSMAGGIVLLATVASCVAEQEIPEVIITSVRCSISQIDVEEDFATGLLDTLSVTKATIDGSSFLWTAGDKIGIVPNKGAQIYFAVDEGAGTSTALFDGGDWAMKSTGTFYAYYPLYPDIFLSKDHVPVSYTGQTQNGNNNTLHTGDYWTLYTEATTAVGNTLNFSFNHLTSFFKTYVTVPAGTYTKITYTAPSEIFIKEGYFDLSAQTPVIVGTSMTNELSLDLQNITFTEETELSGYLVVAPVSIAGVPITVTVYKDGAAAYEYTLSKANNMVASKTYAFRATALTQIAASVAEANALFAAGVTSVSITEPLSSDATIVLPNTTEAVSLALPTTASSSKLTVSYAPGAESCPVSLSITGPEGADLDINTPNSTVTVNGISYNQITSRTATNTCIIPAGVTVNTLKVIQGGVKVYGTVSQIDLSEQEDDAIISVAGSVTTLLGEDDEEYAPVTGVSLDQSSINLNIGATETLSVTVLPYGAYPNVVWTTSDETVATVSSTGVVTAVAEGSAIITALTVSEGLTATCNVTVGHQYVDLGLSVKWAVSNIGATNPEDTGDYFAWGETESKSDYSWNTYRYSNGSETTLTKYCVSSSNGSVDNNIILDAADDAAQANWGGNWRMPTREEFDELIDNCSWSWITQNGVTGYKVTGPNNNSIFVPLTGYIDGSTQKAISSAAYYWTSSLDSERSTHGKRTIFNSNSYKCSQAGRYYGFPVRPVHYDDPASGLTGISVDKSSETILVGESTNLVATVSANAGAVNKAVQWSSSDTSIATVDYSGKVTAISAGITTITAETVFGGFKATCSVTVAPKTTFEYVDLGLPSGIKWATFNLGATKPEETGDYYQWAGNQAVTSKSIDVCSSNCPYHTGSSSSSNWSKYIPTSKSTYWSGIGEPDNLEVLDEGDDAAQRVLGGKWRMPTVGEYLDLTDKCTMTWTNNYNSTGVCGYIITSKMSGYTDKSFFLPAAGYRSYSTIYSTQTGYYWTSTLYTNEPSKAAYFVFSSSENYCAGFDRYYGILIRPVYDENYHEHSLVLVPGKDPTETSPGWKACYKCSVCGKYLEVDHKPIGDEAAYLAWKSKGGNGYLELPSAVDLGLSVKWASCNIGADNAYSYGDYYAWGETEPKTNYSSSSHKYGWEPNLTKYCTLLGHGTVDNKIILDLADDAAFVNWGGNWRMPTEEEIKELVNSSKCSWTKYNAGNTEFNGVEGYKVQSLKPGYTDNFIFIPCTGYIDGQTKKNQSYPYYWSSSLKPFSSYSTYATRLAAVGYGSNLRYYGYPVRAVSSEDASSGVTGISLDRSSLTICMNDSFTLTPSVVMNSGAVNNMVEWNSSDPSIATVDYNGNVSAVSVGTATITAKTHFGGFTSNCSVTVLPAPEPEYVDLGLSVKWATFNLGAARPSGYGKYYAWGETKGYGEDDPSNANNYSYTSSYTRYDYSWSNYKWYDYSTRNITKYCTDGVNGVVDNKIILEKEDDAAYVNWGENWRMPTLDEFSELSNSDNCSWTWYDETNTEFDGVRGYKVQSLKPGYTDKYIFLPISRVHRDDKDSRTGCGYWTSSLYKYNWGAIVERISAYSTADWGYIEDNDSSYGRYNGYNIRPVYSEDAAGGVTGVSLNKTALTMYLGEIVSLDVSVSTVEGGVNKAVVWTTSDPSVTSIEGYYYYSCNVTALTVGTSTVTVRSALGGFEATCTVTVEAPPEVDADYVDLGLPSGTLWAAYNIGATAPEEYGDFFAWGETVPWRNGGWSIYKHCNGSSSSITKYKSYGAVLESIDDAAYLNWGSNWRMPTNDEWNELLSNCTWTWTTLNGVNGYLVTSNTNSNSIFLPAAGYRGSSSQTQGSSGFYWSSTLAYSSTAYYLQFSSGSNTMSTNLYRHSGLSVRAVRR